MSWVVAGLEALTSERGIFHEAGSPIRLVVGTINDSWSVEQAMAECRVKKFVASWSNWSISWNSGGCGAGSSTIQLPVTFTLELEEGSTKADCIVGQEKR